MSATGKTALKAFFETGDVPTQAQFADTMDSFPNIVDGNLLVEFDITVVPVDPPTQGTAYPLTKYLNYTDNAVANLAGVLAPPALINRQFIFVNDSADSITMFGDGTDAFNMGAGLTEIIIPAQTQVNFNCLYAGFWTYSQSNIYYQSYDLVGSENMITPVTPSSQGTAYPLTKLFNNITGGNVAGSGVILPEATPTLMMFIRYANTYPLDIYPASGQFIDGYGTDIPLPIQYNANLLFYCTTGGTWSV